MYVLSFLFACFVQTFVETKLTVLQKRLQNGFYEGFCIAEDDLVESPIAWIGSNKTSQFIGKSESSSVFRILPEISEKYFCDFESESSCPASFTDLTFWELKEENGLILDKRWERFPLRSENNTELNFPSNNFRSAFSVYVRSKTMRAYLQLRLCPVKSSESCYGVSVINNEIGTNIILTNIYQNNEEVSNQLKNQHLLLNNHWHHFELSYANGELLLQEIIFNLTLVRLNLKIRKKHTLTLYTDNLLWKTHKNKFLYTNKTGEVKLGPSLRVNSSSELCISAYVYVCGDCYITFRVMDGNQKRTPNKTILMQTRAEWKNTKFLFGDIDGDTVDVYVTTQRKGQISDKKPFWAVDEIRICNPVEIKISVLKVANENKFTCQLVTNPNFPVEKKVTQGFSNRKQSSTVQQQETSLVLEWGVANETEKSYCLIHYQSVPKTDTCKKRNKSSGYLIANNSKIHLNDLEPFTIYNIILLDLLTNEREEVNNLRTTYARTVREEELPKNVNSQIYERYVSIKLEMPQCTYGPLFYCVNVTDYKNYNKLKKGSKNAFYFWNLTPNTTYSAIITTSRDNSCFVGEKPNSLEWNFTTKIIRFSNLQYKIASCYPLNGFCHLNATWDQPNKKYNITSYNIHLNRTEFGMAYNQQIDKPSCSQLIRVSFDTSYNLSVQAVSEDYKSEFETIRVLPIDSKASMQQKPAFVKWEDNVLSYEVPERDSRLSSANLVVVLDAGQPELHQLCAYARKYVCNNSDTRWTARVLQLSDKKQILHIGDGRSTYYSQGNCNITNRHLESAQMYHITFIIMNDYDGESIPQTIIFNEIIGSNSSFPLYASTAIGLVATALLILACFAMYIRRNKKKKEETEAHVVESLSLKEVEVYETLNDLYGCRYQT